MDTSILKKMNYQLIDNLTKLFDNTSFINYYPVIEVDNIILGNFVIKKLVDGYEITNIKDKNYKLTTWSKSGALALVQAILFNKKNAKIILHLDETIAKNEIDTQFYKSHLKVCKNKINKQVTKARLLAAIYNTNEAKRNLEEIIFSSL